MKRATLTQLFLLVCTFTVFNVNAQNPIIQTVFTADPAPLVYNDTLYLYTGHDEDKSTWFTMQDWRCYTTTDMVNWTDHGSPLSLKTFSWATKDAWAGQCIFRNGKFYWYVPVNHATMGMSIGVAVASSAYGPFKDALGKPLLHSGNGDIDPTVFIDDDGQAYLYWGNPYLKYVKLKEDMISLSGEIINVPLNAEGFSKRIKDADKRPSEYEEGPWLYKRKDLYYMAYPAGGVPEHLAYSTSPTATGPWTYRDTIMPVIQKGGTFTNHPAIIGYKGKSYLFYHNGALPGGGGFNRSVCVEEFTYSADGSIPRTSPSSGIVKSLHHLNPFKRVEAETIAWEAGIETIGDSTGERYVTEIDHNDYIKLRSVDFKNGATSFEAGLTAITGGSIEIHLDSLNGERLGTLNVSAGEGKIQSCKIIKKTGVHDLFLVFKGTNKNMFNFNWWKFRR